ncbi:hypothetical protein LG307_17995 [Sutcliffiella horikoshii]|uniref:DUF6944 family repetitive protein n=1 Tax=Sutcliffiella horikoshii TaxID=79883 RepID=UPI00385027D1
MQKDNKQLIGVWTQAVGTVVAAIGSTPSVPIDNSGKTGLQLVGNILQAGGNGLEADAQEELTYGKLGNIIQATGNLTVSMGLTIDFPEDTNEKLIITGDFTQALGALTALGSADRLYLSVGNLLQAAGNSLQAVGGIRELQDESHYSAYEENNNEDIIALGSWIQAIGTIIIAIGVTDEWIK